MSEKQEEIQEKKIIKSPEQMKESRLNKGIELPWINNLFGPTAVNISNGANNLGLLFKSIADHNITLFRSVVLTGHETAYVLNYNGVISQLQCSKTPSNKLKGDGIHIETRSFIKARNGALIPDDTYERYTMPKKGYYTVLYPLMALVFYDKDDLELFIETIKRIKTDPYNVMAMHLAGFYQQLPFCGCGLINLSDNDYYTVLNQQLVKVPKMSVSDFQIKFPKTDLIEYSKDHDVFVVLSSSHQDAAKTTCKIYDLQHHIETQRIKVKVVAVKKVHRTSIRPIFIKGVMSLALFGNHYSAKAFLESEFKGNIDYYFISKSLNSTRDYLDTEYKEKEIDIQKQARGLFNLNISHILTAVTTGVSLIFFNKIWSFIKNNKESILEKVNSLANVAENANTIKEATENMKEFAFSFM